MKAIAVSLLAIFEKKLRLEVPLFQRQYVLESRPSVGAALGRHRPEVYQVS